MVFQVFKRLQSMRQPTIIYEKKSGMRVLQVLQFKNSRALTFGGEIYQTYIDEGAQLQPLIWNIFLLAPFFREKGVTKPASLCLLGLGGGVAATRYATYFPSVMITSVDSDREVITIAKKFFPLPKQMRIVCDDALHFLQTTKELFDYMIVDLTDENATISLVWQREFLAALTKKLSANGVVVINSLGKKKDFIQLLANCQELFSSVFTIPITMTKQKNQAVFATKAVMDIKQVSRHVDQETRPEFWLLQKHLHNSIKQVY